MGAALGLRVSLLLCLWGGGGYLKTVRNFEFGCRNSHQIIQQHHDHDSQEDRKVTDGGPNLCTSTFLLMSIMKLILGDKNTENPEVLKDDFISV